MDFLRKLFGGAKPKPQPPKPQVVNRPRVNVAQLQAAMQKPNLVRNEQQAFDTYTKQFRAGKIDKNRYNALMNMLGRPQAAANKPKAQGLAADFYRTPVGSAALGLNRSLAGTGEGLSGLVDLATPGKGQNRVGKAFKKQGERADKAAVESNRLLYKGGQLGGDIATFLAGGAPLVKGASKVNKVVPKTPGLVRGANALAKQGKTGKAIVGGAKILTRPDVASDIIADTLLTTGLQSNRGQDISRQSVTNNALLSSAAGLGLGVGGKLISKSTPAVKSGTKKAASAVNNNLNIERLDERLLATQEAKAANVKARQAAINRGSKRDIATLDKQYAQIVQLEQRLKTQRNIQGKGLGMSMKSVGSSTDPTLPGVAQSSAPANQKQLKVVSSTESLPRSQRTGLALSTPESKSYANTFDIPEEQATRELTQATSSLNPANQATDNPLRSSGRDSELLDLGSRRSLQNDGTKNQGALRVSTKSDRAKGLREVSSNDVISQMEDTVKGHKTYDVNKKVSILDKIRTPDKVLRKIGLGDVADKIKDADRNYKLELPKEIDKISKWYDEVGRSTEASQRIFQYLDGQGVPLSGKEAKVANEMKTYLKDWADRLKLPKESRLTNYITHIFDDSLVMKEFDPDLEKLIADKVPGSVYDPFTQQRLGAKGYKEDAFAALDAYVKRGTRKVHMDPVLEELADRADYLDKTGLDYVKQYGDRINMRPTDLDTSIDIMIKNSPVGYKLGQRPVAKISRAIRQATYRATLGMNVGSAVRNLTQGINTFSELGGTWTSKGYHDAIKNWGSGELEKVGVLTDSFIEDRAMSATKQFGQKMDNVLFAMFEGAEKINRGAAYYGAKAKALKAGASLEEAVKIGVQVAEKTQFTFGRVNTPLALQSDIAKLFTQFQSYNVKQSEFVIQMMQDKEFAKLARYVGATGVVFMGMSKALGYRPEDMVPFGSSATTGTAPIGGAPAFKIYGGVKDAISALKKPEGEKDKKPKSEKVKDAFGKLGIKLGTATIPGFVQGKKTVTGLKAVNKGEVKIGNKTYPVKQDTANKVKGAVFGPFALKSKGGETIKQGTATKTPAQEEKLRDLTGKNREEYEKALGEGRVDDYGAMKATKDDIAGRAREKMAKAQTKLPTSMSDESWDLLSRYARLSNEGKKKFKEDPEKVRKLAEAKIERDLLQKKITAEEAEKKSNKLRGIKTPKKTRVKVGKVKKAKKARIAKGRKAPAKSSLKLGRLPKASFKLAKAPKVKGMKLKAGKKPKLSFKKPKKIKIA